MPTISTFYGIIIMMHLTRKEHNPPHTHAYYGEHEAIFGIQDGKVLFGTFPKEGTKLVRQFIFKYKDELLIMWETEVYKKLPPID